MALAANALVTYDTMKAELGLADDASQAVVERLIGAMSTRMEQAAERRFALQVASERHGVPPGVMRVLLDMAPVVAFADLEQYGALTACDPFIEDAAAGFLTSRSGWPSTARSQPGIVRDPDPNQVVADVTLRVLGGWLTGPQYKAAGAWSLGAKAFGALLRTMEGQAWVVTVAGTTAGSEPSWPAGPTAGDTLTDGSVTWTFLGSAPTLPADLEQACIDAVTMAWARRGQNLEVTSESLGNASYSYATGADGGRLSLPASTTDVLANYRRLVMA